MILERSTVFPWLLVGSVGMTYFAERIAHPRRGGKPEFKLERYPPLDGAAC
jgi:hypothetical protein